MRHRVKKIHLSRTTEHRQAMFANLLRSLFLHGEIVTTRAKAKETKRQADIVIGHAKENTLHSRRKLHKIFGKSDIVNALVDKIAPAFKKRTSGFTTIQKFGVRRGDNTEMYKLSLLEKPENLDSFKSDKQEKKSKGK